MASMNKLCIRKKKKALSHLIRTKSYPNLVLKYLLTGFARSDIFLKPYIGTN